MQAAANVTVIPAKKDRLPLDIVNNEVRKLRVAAYARVSTNNEEQLTSYEAQVDYYTRYIQAKEEWEFVEVYTDEGISATNTKKRDGFNRMVADALAGKIDLIITKSISRFARNTVDTLTTVRKLKEKGIEVFFEKENIRTLDHHVLAGAGRKPLHFRERDVGPAETLCRRQGEPSLWPVPWLQERRE